jgi:hypothetical protein
MPGKIRIACNTYVLIRERFHCQRRETVTFKGRGAGDLVSGRTAQKDLFLAM